VPFYSFVEKGLEGAPIEEQQMAFAWGAMLMLDYLSLGTMGMATGPMRVIEPGLESLAARSGGSEGGKRLYAYSRRKFEGDILETGPSQGRLWASRHASAPDGWAFAPGFKNSLIRGFRTGRFRPWADVKEISGPAVDKFRRVRAIGPFFRGWKRAAGQNYTTEAGNLDLATGQFLKPSKQQLFWRYADTAASDGVDAAPYASPTFWYYLYKKYSEL
jgi:hypothetical protein